MACREDLSVFNAEVRNVEFIHQAIHKLPLVPARDKLELELELEYPCNCSPIS